MINGSYTYRGEGKPMNQITAVVAGFSLTFFGASEIVADTINVPADHATIQAAVDASSNGDVVLVSPGIYTGDGERVVEVLSRSLTIRATGGYAMTIIDGEDVRGCIRINNSAELTLDGFTIQNGFANTSPYANGGAMWLASGDAVIKNCAIVNNASGTVFPGGGAIAGIQCIASFTNCLIAHNTTAGIFGGAAAFASAFPIFTDCIIRNNESQSNYGAIFVDINAGGIQSSVVCGNSGSSQTYGPSFSTDSILNDNCETEACGDLDGNYAVDVNDVLILISSWGESGPGLTSGDFDFSGSIDVEDLLYLIGIFGNDCTPLGACCFGYGWCDEFASQSSCQNNGGVWQGEGSSCADCF